MFFEVLVVKSQLGGIYTPQTSALSECCDRKKKKMKVNLHTVFLAFVVVVHVLKSEYFFFFFLFGKIKSEYFNVCIVKYWVKYYFDT